MDVWERKGGTSRNREGVLWSNRDDNDESFDRNKKHGAGPYKAYSITNQASRKETPIFAKPNEPFYKYKQEYNKESKFERNVSSRSSDDPHRDSFSLHSRSSFSKTFDYQGDKFASEAYGQGQSLGTKQYNAPDTSDFDIEPYAIPDKNLRRESYISQEKKFNSGPYKSPDRNDNGGSYIPLDRKIVSEPYRSEGSKLGTAPFISHDRAMNHRPYIAQDSSFGSVPYKSLETTFASEPFSSMQEKLDRRAYHSHDSYPDGGRFSTKDKDLGNAPYISQSRNLSSPPLTHDRNFDSGPYDLQSTNLRNKSYISKDVHPRSRALDKNIVERPYISDNENIGGVPYSSGDRKHNRVPDDLQDANPGDWQSFKEDHQIKIRSNRSQERDLGSKPYTSQDRRPGSQPFRTHDKSIGNISYISQDKIISSGVYPFQSRTLDTAPYNSQERIFTDGLQQITPSSSSYYLQEKTLNKRPISQDRATRVPENNFSSSTRTFYSSKSRDEPLVDRKTFISQSGASYVNKLDIAYTNKPVSYNIKPRLYDNEPQSYGKKPTAYVDSPRSYDNRPKHYDNKRPSVEAEPQSYVDKPRSFDNRPGFGEMERRTGDNNNRSFDNRPQRFVKKHPSDDDTLRSFGDKLGSYDNRSSLRDREKRLDDNNHRSINKRPERIDDELPSRGGGLRSFSDKLRSYDNRPALRDIKERSDNDSRRSFDNRAERFENKHSSRENEPCPLVAKPRYYDNRPNLHERELRSDHSNQRSFDNRQKFDSKRPPLDNEPRSFITKPRFYNNKPGIGDMKLRSENDNQRSFDDRAERFNVKGLSQNNEPRSFISKPKSYDNRLKICDIEPKPDGNNRRSPLYDEHRSHDSPPRFRVNKPRSYDNRPAFRNINARSVDYDIQSDHEEPKIGLKRKFKSVAKPLMENVVQFPEENDPKWFPKLLKVGPKRKFQSGPKPLMGKKISDPSGKKAIPSKRSIVLASKVIHLEVTKSFVFETCSNDNMLHKMVVFLIRMRMKKIAGATNMDPDTLVKKYRNRHPSVLDYTMAESISRRLDGEEELNIDTEAITLVQWKLLMKQFSNIFSEVKFEPPTKKPTKTVGVGKNKVVKVKKAAEQSTVRTQHPLTIDDIDSAIDARTTDIKNVICEAAEEDFTPDPVKEFVNRKILEEGAEQIKILLTRTLSAALIRPDADEEFLMLRIFGNPKLPSLQQLEKWLEPYHVRQLKKTYKSKNMCIARVKNREAYDALLAMNTPVVAGLPLTIKSSDKLLTAPNMEKYLRKNKTWVPVVSKIQQQKRLKNQLAKQNMRKAAIEKVKTP